MAKSGQARVLTRKQIDDVLEAVKKHRHPEKNLAILLVSFRLGLRAQEMALLEIKEVAVLGPEYKSGRDFALKENMDLPARITKGADAMGRSNKVYERKSITFTKAFFAQQVKNIEDLVKAGGTPIPENFYPPEKDGHKGESRLLPMNDQDLRIALSTYLRLRLDQDPTAKESDRLFISQHGCGYSPDSLQQHIGKMLKRWGGVEKASSHSGRRTLLTNVIQTTKSLKVAQKIAGHKSPATTVIYEEATEQQVMEGLALASQVLPMDSAI